MIPRALRGLRGRLLLALVATSAVTLVVAAAITLSPLRERLRTQSRENLATNDQLLEAALSRKATWCDSGLNASLPGSKDMKASPPVVDQHQQVSQCRACRFQ